MKKDIEAVIVRSCGGQTEDLCECGREVKENKIEVLKLMDEILEYVLLLLILNSV